MGAHNTHTYRPCGTSFHEEIPIVVRYGWLASVVRSNPAGENRTLCLLANPPSKHVQQLATFQQQQFSEMNQIWSGNVTEGLL